MVKKTPLKPSNIIPNNHFLCVNIYGYLPTHRQPSGNISSEQGSTIYKKNFESAPDGVSKKLNYLFHKNHSFYSKSIGETIFE